MILVPKVYMFKFNSTQFFQNKLPILPFLKGKDSLTPTTTYIYILHQTEIETTTSRLMEEDNTAIYTYVELFKPNKLKHLIVIEDMFKHKKNNQLCKLTTC